MRTCFNTITILILTTVSAAAQTTDSLKLNEQRDLLYISEVQDRREPDKVLHAEPLYVDLIRDLGARRGEREWNLGFGLVDDLRYDTYQALIEYEFAPVDRLGIEVELPVTIYAQQKDDEIEQAPGSRIESLKIAMQWSFLVSQRMKTSMALGYINELELSPFDDFGRPLITGNICNPFLIVAKRFGNNWHTLIYSGPRFEQHFETNHWSRKYEINSNLHYMISGTRNFVGVELNKSIASGDFDMVIRPQMRLGIADNFLIGIVSGIPVSRENQRFSMFTRLIWEPKHKLPKH